jgi:signal transduction histidine kinase
MLFLAGFITFSILIYQRNQLRHRQEKKEITERYAQELLKAQLEIKEQTLHIISQEIHDNIGQVLSLVKLNLNAIHPEGRFASKINSSKELVSKAIQDLRTLSKTLNTSYLNHILFSEALQYELDLIEKSELYRTTLEISGTERKLESQRQLMLFRITQEILNNIMKHAKASHIVVSLDYSGENLSISIKDNGIGFEMIEELYTKGTGLGNMFHRARLIDSLFEIQSFPGNGTTVKLSVPC